MHKVLANVAAFVLGLALVLLAQPPQGVAPAGKGGPDAATADLVSAVCAVCHTLDPVKNKEAGKDGWTTTVTGMQDKGAALTDEQVPCLQGVFGAALLVAKPQGDIGHNVQGRAHGAKSS